jgi:hypothetical protein
MASSEVYEASSEVYEIPYIDTDDPETIIKHLNIKNVSYLEDIKNSISIIQTEINKDNKEIDFNVIKDNINSICTNINFYYSIIANIKLVSSVKNSNKEHDVSNFAVYKKTDYINCLEYFEEIIKKVNNLIDTSKIPTSKKYVLFLPIKNLQLLKNKITELKEDITKPKNVEIATFGGKKNKKTKRRLKNKKTNKKKNVKKSRKTKRSIRR